MAGGDDRTTDFVVVVPPELKGGAYANFLIAWYTVYEFTLDFAATQIPEIAEPDDPDAVVIVPCRVVSRVRIPATLIFDVIRALNARMTEYESRFGEIRRPQDERGDER